MGWSVRRVGRSWRAALVVVLAAGAFVLPGQPARALPSDIPDETWVTNGNVHAVTRSGDRIYLGGSFDQVGPSTGFGVVLDPTTGVRASFPKVNGEVFVAASDGAGGWYIGGDFTRVGSASRHNAARIMADGSVGQWNPNTDLPVRAIANGGGAGVFIGGPFTTLRGAACATGLARTHAVSGDPTCLNSALDGEPVTALAMAPNGTTLYVGLEHAPGGPGIPGIRAVNASTGAVVFSGAVIGPVSSIAPSADGTRIYVGGDFHVGAVQTGLVVLGSTGAVDPTWDTFADGDVSTLALTPDGSRLYLGGDFNEVGEANRPRLAAVDTAGSGSVVLGFDPQVAGQAWGILATDDPLRFDYEEGLVTGLAISNGGSRLHAAGFFSSVGGQRRRFLASLNPATGAPDLTFDPRPGAAVVTVAASADGSRLFAGGHFTSVNGTPRANLAALSVATGAVDSGFSADTDKPVNAIVSDGASVYIGGQFQKVGPLGATRRRVAKVDAATGALAAWDPSVSSEVRALARTPTGRIVLGGTFTQVDGATRNHIASVSATGELEAWNPNIDTGVFDLAVTPDGSRVFAAGSFGSVGSSDRDRLAAIDLATGQATAWVGQSGDPMPPLRRVAISPDGQRVFVGTGGAAGVGNRVQAFSAVTGAMLWQQRGDGDFTGLDVSGSVVYAGGHFTEIGDLPRGHLAAFDQLTGAPHPWGPTIAGVLGVLDIEVTPGAILVAGEFHKVGTGATQVVQQGLARFAWTGDPGFDPNVPPTQPPTTSPPGTQPPGSARFGYWMVSSDGEVYPFGDATDLGDARGALPRGDKAVDLEPTPSGRGYWIVDDDGRVYPFGDARSLGGVDGTALSSDEVVTSLSSTPSGAGYWLFTSRGRAVPRGDATHYGDMSAVALNGPVLDSIPTPSGRGYYMVASDGGIFAFGDAAFFGSMGGKPLNEPVQSLVPDPDGMGYWLVASDGGAFAFEASFRGSMGGQHLNKPVTGMVPYGNGYLMVAEDGGIFNFSDRPFSGSLGSNPPGHPVVSVAALDG